MVDETKFMNKPLVPATSEERSGVRPFHKTKGCLSLTFTHKLKNKQNHSKVLLNSFLVDGQT